MKKLSHEQYLAFLLLYAAYADLELQREEAECILSCIDRDVFVETHQYFLSLSEKDRLGTVMAQKNQYLGNPQMVKITLNEIRKLFICDQKMLPIEQFYYNFLKMQLQSG
ncbi:hypothetical protein MASR1M74_15520 [Lentimicrobium sp.]